MTSRELSLWRAFDEVEPIGDWRHDLGHGMVASTVANYAGKSMREGAEPLSPRDFMPLMKKPAQSKTEKTKELIQNMRNYFSKLARRRSKGS